MKAFVLIFVLYLKRFFGIYFKFTQLINVVLKLLQLVWLSNNPSGIKCKLAHPEQKFSKDETPVPDDKIEPDPIDCRLEQFKNPDCRYLNPLNREVWPQSKTLSIFRLLSGGCLTSALSITLLNPKDQPSQVPVISTV